MPTRVDSSTRIVIGRSEFSSRSTGQAMPSCRLHELIVVANSVPAPRCTLPMDQWVSDVRCAWHQADSSFRSKEPVSWAMDSSIVAIGSGSAVSEVATVVGCEPSTIFALKLTKLDAAVANINGDQICGSPLPIDLRSRSD